MNKEKKIDISVCIPAIRHYNWKRFYDSVKQSVGNYSFEVILCGPEKEVPIELQSIENLIHIQDFGSPVRAHQLACIAAKGEYITWGGDDGWFLPNKLKECLDLLKKSKKVNKALVSIYIEGGHNGLGDEKDISIYTCNHHIPTRSKYNNDKWLIYNTAIVQKSHFDYLGGFDCQFQVPATAIAEFGIRSQRSNCSVEMLYETTFECDWLPGDTGDHKPIFDAQLNDDIPILQKMLADPEVQNRIKIPLDNWKNSPAIWKRRFVKNFKEKELIEIAKSLFDEYLTIIENSNNKEKIEDVVVNKIEDINNLLISFCSIKYLEKLIEQNTNSNKFVAASINDMLVKTKENMGIL